MNLKRLLPLLIVPLLLTACPSGANRTKNGPDLRNLPREIRSGEQGPFHVQGIAVDLERGYIYFSFTTKLLKMDFEGNLIGSVDGMTGHLGCLTMNPADGRVYGSLEYKDDAIGKGIRRTLDAGQVAPEDEKDRTGFYVAIFDVDRITRPDMDAEKDRVMTTVYIKEAVDDYFATAENGRAPVRLFGHRRRDLRAPVRSEGGRRLSLCGLRRLRRHPAHGQRLPGAARLRHEGLEAFRAAALAGKSA